MVDPKHVFIKHCGFDGLIYKSAMGLGTNYALFTDEKAHPTSVKHYRIDSTRVELHEVVPA